jgi:putative cardiolipin synthase
MKTLNLIYLIISVSFFSCSEKTTEIPEQKKDFCASIHRNDSTSLSKELEPVAELMQNKTGVYVF